MTASPVTLREITTENRSAVSALKVGPGQDLFVASVAASLDEATLTPQARPWYRAIYAGDAPVGFVMLSWDVTPSPGILGPWFLWRLLIDERHQRRGYGRAALADVIERIRAEGATEMLTSYQPGEGNPWPFYERFGFVPTGDVEDGEKVLRLDLNETPRRRDDEPIEAMPAFVPPMLATLVAAPFDHPDWQFEVKWDGFRVEAVVDDDEVRLWTRGQQDAARYFGPFLAPPTWITARQAIIDGEVIALDERGEPDFALLQARIKGRGRGGVPTAFVYEVFDLLFLDGRSLLDEPLEERRRLLGDVLRDDPRVRLSEDIAGEGVAFFEAARERGLEGIMAKDSRSTYLPGKRSMAWQKVKIRPEQELVVGGWTRGTGKAIDLGALLVGVYEDGQLRYTGKIGAGFNDAIRGDLLAAIETLAAEDSPFEPAPPRAVARNAQWLKPELVIRAEFAGWTGDGLVRQAAYKGLDLGKDPRAVRREEP